MTTIIAMQDDEGVRMMADTQITASGIPYFHADMQKVIQRGQYFSRVRPTAVDLYQPVNFQRCSRTVRPDADIAHALRNIYIPIVVELQRRA